MKHILSYIPANFWAGFVLTLLLIIAAFAADAQGRVVIKGTVLTTTHADRPIAATLEASDGEVMPMLLANDGSFEVDVPEGDRYFLHFTQFGSITKTIEVDATNALCEQRSKRRALEFDVLLSAADGGDLLRYAGPVGRIRFSEVDGSLAVGHAYHLVMPTSVFVAGNVE